MTSVLGKGRVGHEDPIQVPRKVVYSLSGSLYFIVNSCHHHAGTWHHPAAVKRARSVTLAIPGTPRARIGLLLAALLTASCQPLEQGYWMKPGLTETSRDAQYRRDSGECVSQGAEQVSMHQTSQGDTIVSRHPSASYRGSNIYGRCMASRGYEWVNLQPLVPPSPHQESAILGPCPAERVVTDPFGYPHCASSDPTAPAGADNVPHEAHVAGPQSTTTAAPSDIVSPLEGLPSGNVPLKPPSATHQFEVGHDNQTRSRLPPAERRALDNSLCIQESRDSLSSPYATYLHCMEEKGWPALPR